MPQVFISYRQTNVADCQRVRAFCERLRRCAINVVLDQFFLDDNPGGPNEGWDKWSSDHALRDEHVIIIGTHAWFQCFEKIQKPGTGLGAACEADDLRHRIYEAGGVVGGIRVVLFSDDDAVHVPAKLKRYHRFHADRDLDNIIRWLQAGAEEPLQANSDRASSDDSRYRLAHLAKYRSMTEGRRLVTVMAMTRSGTVAPAAVEIEKWAKAGRFSDLMVLGDPGSGKTYLLRQLCSRLSEAGLGMPVFISTGQLQNFLPRTRDELLAFTDPPAPSRLLDLSNVVVVLDGLDELIGPSSSDQPHFAQILEAVGSLIPRHARLVYSCRSATFEATSKTVTEALRPKQMERPIGADPTDEAIRSALLGRGRPLIETLELAELSKGQAQEYLLEVAGPGSDASPAVQYVIDHLPRVPVILRFLELALPVLRGADGCPDLDELYAAAMRAWILRDPTLVNAGPDEIWTTIKGLSSRLSTGPSTRDIHLLVHSGLLARLTSGHYVWSHSSIGEFFLALSVFDELRSYCSSTLARLDLIGAYNINRFLVPRCRRTLVVNPDSALVRPVSCREYLAFLRDTDWRQSTGYGVHPSYVAEDGTGFVSGLSNLRPERDAHPTVRDSAAWVTGLSWYDAFAYCLWAGKGLPTADRVRGVPLPPDAWAWCADWSDERRAHVAVATVDAGGAVSRGGANPDVRHSRIGLVIVEG